jgi:diguanylate cyclase (GGDEF)-like protein
MASHVRIRILLAAAVAVICGGVFVVTESQRRADATSFEEYKAVQSLRSAAMRMSLTVFVAADMGPRAEGHVRDAQAELGRILNQIQTRAGSRSPQHEQLLQEQARAASDLAQLAGAALRGRGDPSVKRAQGISLDRFLRPNDALLSQLAAERQLTRRNAARRPVGLVIALCLIFGVLHLLLVEGPAREERRRRRARSEFGSALQVARSEHEIYDVVSQHVGNLVGASHVTVLRRNPSADRLEPVTPVRPGSAVAEGVVGAAPISCLAVRLSQTQAHTPDDGGLVRCDICGRSPEMTTCVPSIVSGEVVGAVLVEHEQPLGRSDRDLVEQSVAEAAPVVANLRNLAIAEMRAATDGLTGLPNQRTVHDTLKRACAHAGRAMTPLALVLFDLDHFKAINDTYGHGKGDEVLAAVGDVAGSTLRASDFIGRFGGEEFAVILPDTGRQGAVEAAEKLRVAVASIRVPGIDRQISGSFGVAVLPDDAGEPDELFRTADRALYAAKHAGRNRVEVAVPAA